MFGWPSRLPKWPAIPADDPLGTGNRWNPFPVPGVIFPSGKYMRRLITLIALALVAAACGGGESSATLGSADAAVSETLPAESPEPTPSTSGSETTPPPPAGATTTTPPPAPAELPDSDYPDVVVADLSGGEVNLRELALEPQPVLLWFWAPH